jgi:hypothetical protein
MFHLNQKTVSFCDASTCRQGLDGTPRPAASRWETCSMINIDVVVGDIDGGPMVLRNRGISGRHWVSFELTGTKSNRLALNARITIVAGG